ncbi:hypothetical protein BDR26DRAFT_955769 [Obelidium mucronatum]|nr:hypothetical protein BDR26DRAFT_963362 [Obelidium mucronatum]KAI9346123.1 hypothetical protein BDR26DRAFT_955769 [Obelidium mucronatum]
MTLKTWFTGMAGHHPKVNPDLHFYRTVFQYLAIPYLNGIFDEYRRKFNLRDKRLQRNRVLPSGAGSKAVNLMHDPHLYQAEKMGIQVDPKVLQPIIDGLQSDKHSQLFPDEIKLYLIEAHQACGKSKVTSIESIWPVMKQMVTYINNQVGWAALIHRYQGATSQDLEEDDPIKW